MNYFIPFDFETDGKKPHKCQPVQVASIVIDPHNLQIIEGSEFCSDIKPEGIDDIDTYLADPDTVSTLKWHMKIQKKTQEEVLDRWRNAPPQKQVWQNFVQHINKYNPKSSQKTAPVPCGMNILNFDLPIADRLNEKYKVTKLFNYKSVDLMHMFYYSLVWDTDIHSFSMDNMRKYFGMPSEHAHDALQDVIDEANFIIRYLQFFKNVFIKQNNPYKNSFRKCELV